jgi:hypothetical protein
VVSDSPNASASASALREKGKNHPHQNPITRFQTISHLEEKPSLAAKRPKTHRPATLAPKTAPTAPLATFTFFSFTFYILHFTFYILHFSVLQFQSTANAP